jgi:hypothetical protein
MTRSSILILIGLAFGPVLFAQSYTQIIVFVGKETVPNSINENGEIAGLATQPISDIPEGFVRAEDGTITTFKVPQSAIFGCGSRKLCNIISGDACGYRDFPIQRFRVGFDCRLSGEICSVNYSNL